LRADTALLHEAYLGRRQTIAAASGN